MFSNHVTRNFSAYCNGELSAEESRRFNEHVIACAKCRAQFDDIKLGVKFAEQLPSFSAPENLWANIETKLGTAPTSDYVGFGFGTWRFQVAAVAAGLLIVATLGIWLLRRDQTPVSVSPSWEVQRIDGTLRVGELSIANKGEMSMGEWVQTGEDSKAQISVASIGQVEIGPDTKVRLLQTQPTEHRTRTGSWQNERAHLGAPSPFLR